MTRDVGASSSGRDRRDKDSKPEPTESWRCEGEAA